MPKPASSSAGRAVAEAGTGEALEGAGAVGDRMLAIGLHLAEGQRVTIGNEHRIIAETFGAAGWPNEMAVNLALEERGFAVWPGQAQGGGEIGPRTDPFPTPALLYLVCHPL